MGVFTTFSTGIRYQKNRGKKEKNGEKLKEEKKEEDGRKSENQKNFKKIKKNFFSEILNLGIFEKFLKQ